MSIASYIVIALAMGICSMLLFRRCAEAVSVNLLPGLGIVSGVALVHVILYGLGALLGSAMCFYVPEDPDRYNDLNAYVFLGLVVVVAFKTVWPYLRREPRLPVFDLTRTQAVLAMAVASGINVLLLGIGTGFAEPGIHVHKLVWPLLITSILLGSLGLMFGRQRVDLRPRRWAVIASVLLLGVAVGVVVSA